MTSDNSTNSKSVLICGASIAGPILAWWLSKFGFMVTVIERADELRVGGQNIDIKGAAQEVAAKMGILPQIKEAGTGEKGTRYVDADGRVKAEFAKGEFGGLTTDLEILRGDLVRILYDSTKSDVEYIFGDSVTTIHQQQDYVDVVFEHSASKRFDIVIGADGLRSSTRELIFGDEPELRYLGLYTSYFTIPKGESDSDWAQWYFATKSRNVLLRPDNEGTTRASLNFLCEDETFSRLSQQQQKLLLRETFARAGWDTDRVLKGLEHSDDLYLDAVTQVRAPRWSDGRVALVGDAAHSPTPISGKGTALAMIGAYILANELSLADSPQAAFRAYDQKLRPYVESV